MTFLRTSAHLLTQTARKWSDDNVPQMGAALAYYTVFSLAPLVLLIVAGVGLVFRHDPAGAWTRLSAQMGDVLGASGAEVVQSIAQGAAPLGKTVLATVVGVALALVGAAGVFGQLQDALNIIWGVTAKPGQGIRGVIRARFRSFAMVGGVCALLLASVLIESLLKGFGVLVIADFPVSVAVFALLFKVLPDAEIRWRDVWVGALLTAVLFVIGKWALSLYFGSGSAGSAYGAASSLIMLLLWIYYSAQIFLFGAEFTKVHTEFRRASPAG